MIEIKNHAEAMVLKIINDAKAKKYKFNERHPYQVNSDELDIICALLLKLNISVHVKEVTGDICDIEIAFVSTKDIPKLTYIMKNANSTLEDQTVLEDLSIDDDMKIEIDLHLKNIRYDLHFDHDPEE